jgi:hypothetical protein
MDIPLVPAGNFMELRSNHFHSGVDLKTQGREGIPVRAVADGWVSRIKISPWGYGKAVYIDHPGGHTSVYAHLSELKGAVAEACLDAQYRARDYSIDIHPEAGRIPVAQGEVIALSGNTGGSTAPHLHFEMRRTAGQVALDPEVLGLELPDSTPPRIDGIRIHALNDTSAVAPYPTGAKGYATQGGEGRYALKPGTVPVVYGTVGLSVHTHDRYDNSPNKCGVRRIVVMVDSVQVWSATLDEVDFDLQRYCNAHMEYDLYKRDMHYHRCFRLPNNRLRLYGKEPAQGRIPLQPGGEHQVEVIVTDRNGNRSQLSFTLRGATHEEALHWPGPAAQGSLFRYDVPNVLEEEGVRLELPALALYDDSYVRYSRSPAPRGALAPVHVLHDPFTPIHSSGTLRIAMERPAGIPTDKLLLVTMDAQNRPKAAGGQWTGDAVQGSIRAFGAYSVMADTVPPVIANVDLRATMQGRRSFRIKVTDDLSGVDRWKAMLDSKWILMEYDPKTNTLTHHFDKHSSTEGARAFVLEVSDERGNTATWSMTFTR